MTTSSNDGLALLGRWKPTSTDHACMQEVHQRALRVLKEAAASRTAHSAVYRLLRLRGPAMGSRKVHRFAEMARNRLVQPPVCRSTCHTAHCLSPLGFSRAPTRTDTRPS